MHLIKFLLTIITYFFFSMTDCLGYSSFALLNEKAYQKTVYDARNKLDQLMKMLKPYRQQSADNQIAFIAKELADLPYLSSGAMGEGDWQPASLSYQSGQSGSVHIKQYPVYRLDGFDCQTFVQVVMALLHSDNLAQFDQHILKIAYGAAGNPNGEIVHYYNRNNFTDGDFNPLNERNGYLQDVTSKGPLAPVSRMTEASITRDRWFALQQKNTQKSVQVLHQKDGDAMVERFKTIYASLNFPNFKSEKVTLSYLPKAQIALLTKDGNYLPNFALLDKIPTPAVIEIVRDAKKWTLHGKPIQESIGSELNVSHTGILYRETFKKGDVIYQKVNCVLSAGQRKCVVKPMVCQMTECHELMMVHATASHPDGYFWYKNQKGNQLCTRKRPDKGVPYSMCNRVERIPLFAYLTNFQYGRYLYMQSSAILGIHVEKLR